MKSIKNSSINKLIISICKTINSSGGCAFIVGGAVRDLLMGKTIKDYDIEVYHLQPDVLKKTLLKFGTINTVGANFTVYKLGTKNESGEQLEIDISLPRRDTRSGKGHRGFTVTGDPFMSFKEAARRRDFTMNAIMYSPAEQKLIDPYKGVNDIKNHLIKAVDHETFIEDSLRVLRAMQFAGRFEFTIEKKTAKLCRSISLDDLPAERIWGEFEKLLLNSRRPSIGLIAALDLLIIDKLLPELKPMAGQVQDPTWHPEGDVFTHTMIAVDNAVHLSKGLSKEKRITIILAELLHDIAKPVTTLFERGHIRSPNHEEKGREGSTKILRRLNLNTINGYNVKKQVIALVTNHLKPSQFYHYKDVIKDSAFRRLANKCPLDLLYIVSKADGLASGSRKNSDAHEWFIERARRLSVENAPPKPILLGRHLIKIGVEPSPEMGKILNAVFEMQLDGKVVTLQEAIEAGKGLFATERQKC